MAVIINVWLNPPVPTPHSGLGLSLVEARTRFVQLARLASLTNQTTIVTDGGRVLAAIVPINNAQVRDAQPEHTNTAAAGWINRIERLRADLRRQHVGLEQALEQVWQELDNCGHRAQTAPLTRYAPRIPISADRADRPRPANGSVRRDVGRGTCVSRCRLFLAL